MKKVLVLGGSDIQIPLINRIKEMGYYVISCDYLPNNPGHKVSDEFHNISVVDEKKLFNLCKTLKVDAIIPYTSEAAVITSCQVCEKLNLPTNNVEISKIMTKKNLFRDFLTKNGFNVPKYKTTNTYMDAQFFLQEINSDCVIKPVDACGSKGVFKVTVGEDFKEKFEQTMSYSKDKQIIIEQFIKRQGHQIGGDGFVKDGILEFACFGDIHFSKTNFLLPCSVSLPSTQPKHIIEKIHSTVQELITKVGIQMGGLNFDIVVDENENVYLIEIAARNGGNMIPELTKYCTGVDMKDFVILSSLGLEYQIPKQFIQQKYFSHYVVHSKQSGRIKKIQISDKLNKCILEYHTNFEEGDYVEKYINSTKRIGLMLLKYETIEQMYDIIQNFHEHYKIEFYES
jgi:biotin carboxylase